MSFIEVKRYRSGNLVMLNTAAIERVFDDGDYRRIVFRGGTGAADPETLEVRESYDQLRDMLKPVCV